MHSTDKNACINIIPTTTTSCNFQLVEECRREKLQENDKQKSIIPTTTVTTARRGVVPSARFRTMVTTCQTNGSTQQQEEESVVNVEKKIMTDGTQSSTIPCKKPAGITIATQTTITMDDFLQRQHEQRQRQRCTIKAVIQQKVKYVAIPSTPHICFSSRCSNDQCNNTSLDNTVLTQRRPVVIPASSSDDEYPLQPIDSSEESESEDEQIVSYHPQQPIMPGPPRQEFFPPNRNGGENDLELYDDEEFEHQSPIVVVAPGIVLNNASLEHTENNNGAKRPNNENIEKQIKRYKKSSYLPPTEQTTVTTDQQPKEEKLVLYYCPYQRCRYSAVSRYSFSNHIRKKHDPKFQVLKSSKHVTFKSVSGRTINLNNSGDARDKLKHGDKLSLEDLFSSKEKTVMYYCPYRKCVFPYASLRNARRHFRKTHNVIVPEIKLNKRNLHTVLRAFKTPSGRILDFDENSRDLLDDENDTKTEMIMIKKTVETKENSTKNYCCPYKSCDFNSSTNRQIDVFNHIRYHHDHYFNPYSYEISPHFIFKNPQGKPIYFNEKSRATINYGERISVFFNKRFTQRLK